MEGLRLFGANIPPACRYCERAMQAFGGDKILCDKRGVVLASHKCRAFIYDPLRRVPKKPRMLEKIKDTEFEI